MADVQIPCGECIPCREGLDYCYACPGCGKVHGVARGCNPTPVNWVLGLVPL